MLIKRNRIIDARRRRGLTQDDLAIKVGISRTFLSNIERGEHDPSLKVAQLISKELGESTDYFFETSVQKTDINDESF